MQPRELGEDGREFLSRVSEYLVSLPFDLKIFQEAVAEPDLDRDVREQAAGVLINTLLPQEGTGLERFLDDVVLVRMGLARIAAATGETAESFRARFAEVFVNLTAELELFRRCLGEELWTWLSNKSGTFSRLARKGKRPSQCVDDESTWDELYEDGLEFQTLFDVTDAQVRNKLRRADQIVEILHKRRVEEIKKRP